MRARRHPRRARVASALCAAAAAVSTAPPPGTAADATAAPDSVLLFTSFRKNGEDGLHLAWSADGYRWTAPGNDRSFLAPAVGGGLMRDPSLVRAPDGTFHLVWTTAWNRHGLGYACSRDLIHWSTQKLVDVMGHEPETRNVWAPELFHDAGRFLILWSSTIPGRFPGTDKTGDRGYNHRIYFTETRDFLEFSPTRLFHDPGFNCIDAALARDGDRFLMFLKDETRHPPAKNIRVAVAQSATGTYGPASAPITGAGWAEGPSPIRIAGKWFVYFDRYTERRYGLVTSPDLNAWTDESDRVSFPPDHRHGTVLRVPRSVVEAIEPAAALKDGTKAGR